MTNEAPLAEATIVVFLEPTGLVDLPIVQLHTAFKGTTVRRLRNGLVEADGIHPVYALEREPQHPILIGPASVGVTAVNYAGWPSFRDEAVNSIRKALGV